MTAQPQDRKPPARDLMKSALKLQSATMMQKATLDHVGGKLIMIVGILQSRGRDQHRENDTGYIETIAEITHLTRAQVAERLANKSFEYPDVEIQAVINRASEEIMELLLPKADGK